MAPRIRALLPVLLLAVAVPAPAAVPAPPPASSLPLCLATCPMGDMPFTVTVRDIAMNPVVGSTVLIDFSNCPGAYLCEIPPPPYNLDLQARLIWGTTDATGKISFPLHVGGICGPGGVRVYADGVLMKSYALASPDQNGDGMTGNIIDSSDNAIFGPKIGSNDPTADFDCNGIVDDLDETTFMHHLAQSCAAYVDPVRRSSWGRVKSIYR